MARVLITGSTAGLGRAAAIELLNSGHEIVVHARDSNRLEAVTDLLDQGAGVLVGDLSDPDQTRSLAAQANQLGQMDAVIHNAGTISGPDLMSVNVVAPYLLTALINRPERLIYLSSNMHHGGHPDLRLLEPTRRPGTGTYSDSKLFVTALAAAVARIWPEVFSNAVDPGWVPTRMGGPAAPDDLRLGYLTQTWLATSDHPDAFSSGGYWRHHQVLAPHTSVNDPSFQDRLLSALGRHTGVYLTGH